MSLEDLIAADAKAVFAPDPDADGKREFTEQILYRPLGQPVASAITIEAIVDRFANERAERNGRRIVLAPIEIAIAKSDVASPAAGDAVKISRDGISAAEWLPVGTPLTRATDAGMWHLPVGQ